MTLLLLLILANGPTAQLNGTTECDMLQEQYEHALRMDTSSMTFEQLALHHLDLTALELRMHLTCDLATTLVDNGGGSMVCHCHTLTNCLDGSLP